MHFLAIAALITISSNVMASSFNDVWGVISQESPENMIYEKELPMRKHSLKEMLNSPVDIYEAAKRAITDQSDLFEKNTKKLIRGNGICLAGKWVINGCL